MIIKIHAKIRQLFLILNKECEVFDTTHFPDSLRKYPYRGSGMYLLEGIVTEEFGYATINIEKQAKLPLEGDPRERD